jgi:hypothetical protein
MRPADPKVKGNPENRNTAEMGESFLEDRENYRLT